MCVYIIIMAVQVEITKQGHLFIQGGEEAKIYVHLSTDPQYFGYMVRFPWIQKKFKEIKHKG